MLAKEIKKSIRKSELKFDLDDNQATKILIAYMKWYMYANDVEKNKDN